MVPPEVTKVLQKRWEKGCSFQFEVLLEGETEPKWMPFAELQVEQRHS